MPPQLYQIDPSSWPERVLSAERGCWRRRWLPNIWRMREAWLRGIAANPATPIEILLRLLHDDTRVAWETLCGTRDLPQPVVDAIVAHPNEEVAKHFGRNNKVDPGQLVRLFDGPHPQAQEWLIWGRPDTRQLPDELITILLATDRTSYLMTWQEMLSELVFSQGGRVLPLAAEHPDPRVRAWSCHAWAVFPESLRQRLLHDPDKIVRQAVAETIAYQEQVLEPADLPDRPCHALWDILHNRRLSRALVEHVLARGQTNEVACVAGNASTPKDVVAQLVAHPNAYVRERLAGRGDLTSSQLQRLATDPEKTVRSAASINPQIDESLLADCDIEVSEGNDVRWHPLPWQVNLESSIRKAASPNPLLRREAAYDHRLPLDIMRRLAYDDDLGVRVLIGLHHPETPSDVLLRSYLDYTGPDRSRLTAHANFPTTGLVHLADCADPQVRLLATRDVAADPQLIDRLTRDSDPAVRRAAASCSRLPTHLINQLIHDPELARHAAANPALPIGRMRQLLRAAGVDHLPSERQDT